MGGCGHQQFKKKLKELLGKPYYDSFGQIIFGKQRDGNDQRLLDVRSWGAIQNMFKTEEEAEAFQDEFGQFVVDAIKEKMERER